jgi:single-strand DNA-binding protein
MVSDINVCTFNGRLVKDAELRYTNSGVALGVFDIAVNREYKNTKDASFLKMKLWGKLAESLVKYLEKGKQVTVVAQAVQNRWKDNEGNNHSVIEFHVSDIQMMGSVRKQEDMPEDRRPQSVHDDGPPSGQEVFNDGDIPF